MERTLEYRGTEQPQSNGSTREQIDPGPPAQSVEQPIKPTLPPMKGFWKKELEHFVAPVSPMFFSIHQRNIRDATTEAFGSFGLLVSHLELAYRAGEVYESDVSVGGDGGSPPPWWVLGAMARIVPSLRSRMKLSERAVRTDLESQIFQRWDTEWNAEMERTNASFRSVDLTQLSDADLANHLLQLREFTHYGFYIHFQIGIANLLPIYRLIKVCDDWFGWDERQATQLFHGVSTGSSVGSRDLDRITGMIQREPAVSDLLRDPSTTLEILEQHTPKIAAEIRQHLQTYGCRLIQNDVMSPTFLETPALTLQLLRDRLSERYVSSQRQAEAIRERAEYRANELLALRSSEDRARFQHTLERARWGYRLREENVYPTVAHPFALLRFALLEAGQRLQPAGALYQSSDVFYGEFDEIHNAMLGNGRTSLAETARIRRLECRWTIEHPGPETFGTASPEPDIRGLPRESRELHEALLWATTRMRAEAPVSDDELTGVPASPGQYRGTARVIHTEADFHRLQPGDVLVCPSTSSSWAVLFGTCAALVTDQGGSLSHPAIIAREHGIPAVVATRRATKEITDGQTILVDGTNGRVEVLDSR